MFDLSKLPERIANRIIGMPWHCDDIGKSTAIILLFEEMVLKIEKTSRSSANERNLLGWLEGKLPVPKIIEAETRGDYSFLLMSRVPGRMACSETCMRNIDHTIKALANGLKMLWQIDISKCPCSNVVSEKMKQAQYRIDNNLVDMNDFNPETFGAEGFKNIPDLYDFLDRNRPKEDLVFSHGDFCLPNVFVIDHNVTGFLDWGNGGIADRWQDIALCVRSLHYNHVEYAGCSEREYLYYKALLFSELGIDPNEDKIRYYILLDELF